MSSGVTLAPLLPHWLMSQFWQWMHLMLQPPVKMVPDGTSSGSSPMWGKAEWRLKLRPARQ